MSRYDTVKLFKVYIQELKDNEIAVPQEVMAFVQQRHEVEQAFEEAFKEKEAKTEEERKSREKDLVDRIIQDIEQNKSPEMYWDRNDGLTEAQIKPIIENRNCDDLYNDLIDLNWEYESDLVTEHLNEILSYYDDEISEIYDTDDPEVFYENIIDDFDLRSYVSVEYNIKELFQDIPVRICLFSNYDCMNSHWLTSQEGYAYEDHYFGDFIDALNLNPQKVKKLLVEADITVYGRWPNKKSRDGKEYVAYDKLIQEIENTTSGANLLVFLGMLDLYKWVTTESMVITIPEGNNCGLFDSMYGGGSVLELKLIRDKTIDLKDTGEYPHYGMRYDKEGYGVVEVYCAYESIFGDTVTIKKEE